MPWHYVTFAEGHTLVAVAKVPRLLLCSWPLALLSLALQLHTQVCDACYTLYTTAPCYIVTNLHGKEFYLRSRRR